jgi:hypothetical protein
VPESIDRVHLRDAFHRLAERLNRDDTVGEIYIFGGAAMVLGYRARFATRDVDALFEPRERVHRAAVEVAEEMGLPRWWLNDQAAVYLPRAKDERARLFFDHPNLRVTIVSPDHLLAMKALASRTYADIDDIKLLCEMRAITDVREVEEICARIYPDEPLSDRSRIVIEDIVAQLERERTVERTPSQERERDRGRGPESPGFER